MTPELKKRSLRRFTARRASVRRHVVVEIQRQVNQTQDAHSSMENGISRTLSGDDERQPTRQELRHQADWTESLPIADTGH